MERYQERCQKTKWIIRKEISKKINRTHIEEVLDDTLFMVLSKEECYCKHQIISEDLEEYTDSSEYGAWTAFGWIITTAGLRKMKEEAEENEIVN